MKIRTKAFRALIAFIIVIQITCIPEYEIPTIIKRDQPFNQPYNRRLDNLNDSSADNYERYLGGKKKNRLYNNIVRNFSMQNFRKWLEFSETENLHELSLPEMVENISKMVGKSIDLQNFINLKAGLVTKLLALLDMKLKQIEVLENTTSNIGVHPFDVSSNLGNNLMWKSNLEDLLNNSAAENSNYSLSWNTICEVLDNKDLVVSDIVDTRLTRKPNLEQQLYPEQEYVAIKEGFDITSDHKTASSPTIRDEQDLKRGKEELRKEKLAKTSFVERSSKSKSEKKTKAKVQKKSQTHVKNQVNVASTAKNTSSTKKTKKNKSKSKTKYNKNPGYNRRKHPKLMYY